MRRKTAGTSMAKHAAPITLLLIAALVFHFVTPTLGTQRSCGCARHGHEAVVSCNCPGCAAQRASHPCCSLQDKGTSEEGKGRLPSFKPLRCTCGSQDPMASPGGNLYFIPHAGPESLMITLSGSVQVAGILLRMEDVFLAPDRPG